MRKWLLIVPALLLLAGGCTQEKDELQHGLDDILAQVQSHEKEIADAENGLSGLEKKEQALFSKTVELNIEDRDALESGVSRLQALLEERGELLEEEEAAIDAAGEAAKQLRTLPPSETEKGNSAVARLKEALDTRYELHGTVAAAYAELLEKQRSVYYLLIDENVKRVELEEAIAQVNSQQSKLSDAVRLFNQSTEEVNDALAETQQPDGE